MNSAAARPVYLAGQFSYWSIANESLEYARAVWLVRNASVGRIHYGRYGWSTCSWELKELNPARPECTGEAQPILYHATWHSTSARNTSARNWQQQLDLGGDCIAPRRPKVRRLARQVAKCCLKGRSCCNVPPCVPPPVPSSGLGPCVHRRLSLRCGVRI